MVEQFFRQAPIWLVMAALFLAMALAREFGARTQRRKAQAAEPRPESADAGYILSAALGLLALLVAFSFGMALNRHEARRELVVTEANALGTAYLRTDLLDDPGRLRALMRSYAEARLAFGLTNGAPQRAAEARAEALQPAIWSEAVRLVGPSRLTPLAGLVLAPLNEAFDTAGARKAVLAARLPTSIVVTLVIYFVASAAVMGFAATRAGGRHRIASLAVFALFALALGVVLDLDRPGSGSIRVPQDVMADTVRLMGG